jgi:UPF0176 protein
MAERQRQVELAEARGELHVGAKMPEHNNKLEHDHAKGD